ncbi:MAG: ATP-grasp domain-containing protein [Eggerthellaceae bacterium]|nr:ATP-grasp domain-containing protein [Eggerthellaceae bacterium]
MMKKVLILGTGAAQADAIRALSARGERVYACSYISGDVGEAYADDFRQINIVDEDAVYDYVIQQGIECIYSVGSDIAMPVVASVAKRAGLKSFISADTARICNTKDLLRHALGEDFEGNLRYQELSSPDEELRVGFPLMMKPVDSQGQRGVFKVDSPDEFKERFESSLAFSRCGRIIAEDYVDGNEISVNTFAVDGELVFACVSDRVVWDDYPGGIIHRHLLPSIYEGNAETIAAIENLVLRTQRKLGILEGPAYFQIKVDADGQPKLIEVTPRLDGCHMWRLIRYSTGVDLLKMTLDLLLDGKVEPIGNYDVQSYETEFLCAPPSTEFSKHLFDVSGCDYLQWYYEEGDAVKRMNGYMEKCGYQIRRN